MASSSERPAVVLLSGGLDSATTLAIAKHEGFNPYAISFQYGQRHVLELDCARRIAREMGVARHVVTEIDLRLFGGSALTDPNIPVPAAACRPTGAGEAPALPVAPVLLLFLHGLACG